MVLPSKYSVGDVGPVLELVYGTENIWETGFLCETNVEKEGNELVEGQGDYQDCTCRQERKHRLQIDEAENLKMVS